MGSADMDGIACLRKFDLGLWLIVEVGDVLASVVDIDRVEGLVHSGVLNYPDHAVGLVPQKYTLAISLNCIPLSMQLGKNIKPR
jgi:hypothetical protein